MCNGINHFRPEKCISKCKKCLCTNISLEKEKPDPLKYPNKQLLSVY